MNPPPAPACAVCQSRVSPDANFCAHCGARLRKAGAGERRHAAVLFADIAGYTDLCARVDAETVHELLGAFFAEADGIVRDLGGHVVDHAGDAIVASFGAPRAHDDDPARAVQAALRIHAAAGRLRDPRGGPLRLHAGIASGDVVAATIESAAGSKYTITGEPVNLAARICAIAEAGQTIAADGCRRLFADRFHTEALGERVLKGVAVPVRLWLVDGQARVLAQPPFIGRQHELASVLALMEKARRAGRSMAAGIRGDAGLGKSALASRIANEAAGRGQRVIHTRFLDFPLAEALHPVADLLAKAFDIDASVRAEDLQRCLPAGTGLYAAAADLFGIAVSGPLDVEYPVRLRARGEALAYGLARAAASTPITLVLEDLHWADRDALAVIAAAMALSRTLGALFVWTARPLGEAESLLAGVGGAVETLLIDLPPLEPAEARALAVRAGENDPQFAEQCVARAGGNPLFLVNLLQAGRSAGSDPVPGSLRSVVLARVDRLPAEEQAALQAAAVLGPAFRGEDLEALLQRPGFQLASSLRAGLVRPGRTHHEFSHALVHEAIYSSLLRARRRELHRVAAQLFAGRDAALKAQHLDRAESPEAAAAYLEAARAEWSRHGAEQTLKLARRGLELEPGAPLREALLTLLAQVLLDVGRTREALAAFEQALDNLATGAERCHALLGAADASKTVGDYPASLRALGEAQAIAERLGMRPELSSVHNIRGNVYFAQFDPERCEAEHGASLDHARAAGTDEGVVRALIGQGDAAYARGRLRSAARYFDQARPLAAEHGLLRQEIAAQAMYGLCLMYLGHMGEGLDHADRALASARRLHSLPTEVMVQSIRATLLCNAGAYGELQAVAADALAQARAAQVLRFEGVLLRWAGIAAFAQGDRPLAMQRLQTALRVARKGSLRFNGASLLGAIALVTEEREERERAFDEGLALLAQGSLSHCHLNFYRDAMDAFLLAGEPERALDMAGRLERYAAEEPLEWSRLHARRVRAEARALLAPHDDAAREEAAGAMVGLRAAGLRPPLPGSALQPQLNR